MTHTSMSQFHTGWGTFFGGVRLLWTMMIFQKNLLSFSSMSLVYDPYEHVPISYGVGDVFWQRQVTMDSDDISKESTVNFIINFRYYPYDYVPISYGVWDVFWQRQVTMEVSPNYDFPLETSSKEEAGGDKTWTGGALGVDGGAGRGRDFWGFQAIGLQTNTCESWSGPLCRVPFFGRVEWEERSGKKVKVLST